MFSENMAQLARILALPSVPFHAGSVDNKVSPKHYLIMGKASSFTVSSVLDDIIWLVLAHLPSTDKTWDGKKCCSVNLSWLQKTFLSCVILLLVLCTHITGDKNKPLIVDQNLYFAHTFLKLVQKNQFSEI